MWWHNFKKGDNFLEIYRFDAQYPDEDTCLNVFMDYDNIFENSFE